MQSLPPENATFWGGGAGKQSWNRVVYSNRGFEGRGVHLLFRVMGEAQQERLQVGGSHGG